MSPPPPPPLAGEELQDCEEGTGESSPSPCASHLEPQDREVLVRIHERLRRAGTHQQTLADPFFERRLFRHLHRLPRRYLLDHDLDAKADDVLLHWGILDECADPDKRPVFHARYIKVHNSLIDSFGFIIVKKQKIPSFPLFFSEKKAKESSAGLIVCVFIFISLISRALRLGQIMTAAIESLKTRVKSSWRTSVWRGERRWTAMIPCPSPLGTPMFAPYGKIHSWDTAFHLFKNKRERERNLELDASFCPPSKRSFILIKCCWLPCFFAS
jgi:hypothetical protein